MGDVTSLPKFSLSHDERITRAEAIALSFEPVMKGLRIGVWPNGACFLTCLLLNPILRGALEWDLTIVIGKVLLPEGPKPHAWLESPEGDIIDPTFGQFDGGKPLRIIRASRKTMLGHVKGSELSESDENYYVSCIQPWTGDGGWRPSSGVADLFKG